jgi:hypothetical protein
MTKRKRRQRRKGTVSKSKIALIKAVLDHGRLPHGYKIVRRKRKRAKR